jgi:predicted phosphohydrolase
MQVLIQALLILFFLASPVYSKLSRGPFLQMPSSDAMTVRWRTDKPSRTILHYSKKLEDLHQNSDLVFKEFNANYKKRHEVRLENLEPNTKYYYAIYERKIYTKNRELLTDKDHDQYFFITAPEAGESKGTRVWVLGDPGTDAIRGSLPARERYIQYGVRESYYKYNDRHTDLILSLGDNVYYHGRDKEYQKGFFDFYEEILRHSPVWTTLGNHDADYDWKRKKHQARSYPKPRGVYYNNFTLPEDAESGGYPSGSEAYYSFDFANIHFVTLDSYDSIWEDPVIDPETKKILNKEIVWDKKSKVKNSMIEWLNKDLDYFLKSGQKWLVVFFHHPPYSKDPKEVSGEENGIWMRENVVPLLENAGADLVLAGHNHRYQRSALMHGYYTLDHKDFNKKTMLIDSDLGAEKPYRKISKEGTVYVVAGSSGRLSKGRPEMEVLPVSILDGGSLVLDIKDDVLKSSFLDRRGKVRDDFVIKKSLNPLASGKAFLR